MSPRRVASSRARAVRLASGATLVLAIACERSETGRAETKVESARSAEGIPAPVPAPAPSARSTAASQVGNAPRMLLSLPVSAYRASLLADSESFYLVTEGAVRRLVPGEKPEKLGFSPTLGAALTADSIVYWSDGAIFSAPKRGGEPSKLMTLAHQPQYFVASDDAFAWVSRSEAGTFSIEALGKERPRDVYVTKGQIDSAAMIGDSVFFVERQTPAAYRFGKVDIAGGSPKFAGERKGRSPSMLRAFSEHLYYYAGEKREVRRLSLGFDRDETLAERLICSPIAVHESVYCAQVPGLFELRPEQSRPHFLLPNHDQLMTALAANPKWVVWLRDAGEDRLSVEAIERR